VRAGPPRLFRVVGSERGRVGAQLAAASGRNGRVYSVVSALGARRDVHRSKNGRPLLALFAGTIVGSRASTPLVGDRPPAERYGSVAGQVGSAFGCERREVTHESAPLGRRLQTVATRQNAGQVVRSDSDGH